MKHNILDITKELKKNATRVGFGEALLELGKKNKDVVALSADLAGSTNVDSFASKFPKRFFQMGIAEANMVGVAAGLAAAGKIPFAATFSVFATSRAMDQVRVSVAYGNFGVKVVGTHSGITVGEDGASHQAIEDIALMRSIPGMTIVVPCDYEEAKKATKALGTFKSYAYLRLGRPKMPVFTQSKTPFKIGQAEVFKSGKDLTIVACGHMVYQALAAAEKLEKLKINAEVINCHTIKPLDKKTILLSAKKTGKVLTVEEHNVLGGLGSAVSEVLSQRLPVPMKIMGVEDRWGQSGKGDELLKEYGLEVEDIVREAKKLI